MSPTDAVTATVEVAVDAATAFVIFTEEIGQWWQPGPINWNDPQRAIGTRMEPGVGGRWLEVYDEATGEGFECGRILVWEPGARLVFSYQDAGHQIDGTEVEVRFEAIDGGISHAWDVNGDEAATLLILTMPAGLDEFLREYHAAGSAPNDVKDRIAAKYGITWMRDPAS